MLDRIQHEQTLDVYGHVTCLRAQRNYMVQTEDQYVFIYEALLDAVESGNTEVPADSLYLHVQHLTTLYVADDPRQPAVTGMEIEFKVCICGVVSLVLGSAHVENTLMPVFSRQHFLLYFLSG